MSTPEPMNPVLLMTRDKFADHLGVSSKTIERRLAAGRIPSARFVNGQWEIPMNAQVLTPTETVARQSHDSDATPQDITTVARLSHDFRLGTLCTLEDAAAQLNTTIGGIRRLAAAGHLDVGTYGPNGALRVYVA